MGELDETVYKKKAKLELVIFIVFISGIVMCLLFLIGSNAINQVQKKSLTSEIQKTQSVISEKLAKREAKKEIRSRFWDYSKYTFNLDEFDNNVQNYWRTLMRSKDNEVWFTSFYGKFPTYTLKEFDITTPNHLKRFIENNAYDNDDIIKLEEAKVLQEELSPKISKMNSLTFYQDTEIRKIVFVCLAILFGLLYIVRPLLLFIKGIFNELR
jgi:hypothetical protein